MNFCTPSPFRFDIYISRTSGSFRLICIYNIYIRNEFLKRMYTCIIESVYFVITYFDFASPPHRLREMKSESVSPPTDLLTFHETGTASCQQDENGDWNLVDTCMTFVHRRGLTWLCLATSRVHDLLVLHSVHVPPQAIRFVFGFLACFSPTRAMCHRTDISAKPYLRDSRNWIILDIPLWMYSRRLLQERFKRPLSFSRI